MGFTGRLLGAVLVTSTVFSASQLLQPAPVRASLNFQSTGSNPFYFNGGSSGSAWTLAVDGVTQPAWTPNECNINSEVFPVSCVALQTSSSVLIYASPNPGAVTTWTSSSPAAVGGFSRGYFVSFAGTYTTEGDSIAEFSVDGGTTFETLGLTFNKQNIFLDYDKTLTFRVANDTGLGDLNVTGFSAVEAPAPALAPLAFLAGIGTLGRARRRRSLLARESGASLGVVPPTR